MYNKELAERVKEVRGAMSQYKFAEMIGVSPSGIRSIESGKYMPTAKTLMNIKKKLGISYEYLIEGEGQPNVNLDYAHAMEKLDTMKLALAEAQAQIKSLSSENERLTKIVDKLLA